MTRISALAGAAAVAASLGGIALAGSASAHDGPPRGTVLDFRAIDTDGDGSLTRAELQARAVARLARADADGDGFLDREELVVLVPGGGNAPFRVFSADPAMEKVDRLLALLGATEAGRVEVAAVADRRVNMLLAAVDSDRDAAISQAEADARASFRNHRHARADHRGPDGGPRFGHHDGRGADRRPSPDQRDERFGRAPALPAGPEAPPALAPAPDAAPVPPGATGATGEL
jgi:EF hand